MEIRGGLAASTAESIAVIAPRTITGLSIYNIYWCIRIRQCVNILYPVLCWCVYSRCGQYEVSESSPADSNTNTTRIRILHERIVDAFGTERSGITKYTSSG